MDWFTTIMSGSVIGGFIQNFSNAVLGVFDAVFSFIFNYFWFPDMFPGATTAIASAMSSFTPYFLGLNTVFPVLLLFQILGYIFQIEIIIIVFKVSLLIVKLIRG